MSPRQLNEAESQKYAELVDQVRRLQRSRELAEHALYTHLCVMSFEHSELIRKVHGSIHGLLESNGFKSAIDTLGQQIAYRDPPPVSPWSRTLNPADLVPPRRRRRSQHMVWSYVRVRQLGEQFAAAADVHTDDQDVPSHTPITPATVPSAVNTREWMPDTTVPIDMSALIKEAIEGAEADGKITPRKSAVPPPPPPRKKPDPVSPDVVIEQRVTVSGALVIPTSDQPAQPPATIPERQRRRTLRWTPKETPTPVPPASGVTCIQGRAAQRPMPTYRRHQTHRRRPS